MVGECLTRLCAAIQARGGELLISADHGNVEQMIDPVSGQPHTAHTTNPVPVWWIRDGAGQLRDGGLADVAPTICALLELEPSPEMSGRNLVG